MGDFPQMPVQSLHSTGKTILRLASCKHCFPFLSQNLSSTPEFHRQIYPSAKPEKFQTQILLSSINFSVSMSLGQRFSPETWDQYRRISLVQSLCKAVAMKFRHFIGWSFVTFLSNPSILVHHACELGVINLSVPILKLYIF